MQRSIAQEWLDVLPAADPQACRSRYDLRRLNRIMGHMSILTRQLRLSVWQKSQRSLLEIGAGDGWFMSQVARKLGPSWMGTHLLLLDKQPQPTLALRDFAEAGWRPRTSTADVRIFAQAPGTTPFCATIANLFLHHFSAEDLRPMLSALAARTNLFIAVEPRRTPFALLASRGVGLIGCNSVTRHDAPASVRAGFCDHELSSYWPQDGRWKTCERNAGLFSHLFVAQRCETE